MLAFSVPAGAVVALATLVAFVLARGLGGVSTGSARSAAVVSLFVTALAVLVVLVRPLRSWHLALVLAMAGGGVLATSVPLARRVFDLTLPSRALLLDDLVVAVPCAVVVLALLPVVRRRAAVSRRGERRRRADGRSSREHRGPRGAP